MNFPVRRSARLSAATLSLVLGVAGLAACGGKDAADDSADPQNTADGKTLVATSPLTGLRVPGDAPKHKVMVVKIDNTSASEPQVGLGKADLVTEELVEGGITRLAVAFYSKTPATVGPVRSMRASDIGIVKPTKGVLVASGGAGQTIGRLQQEKVQFFTESGPGYFRDNARRAPYNLMVKLPAIAKASRKNASVPQPYLPFGKSADFKGSGAASKIAVRMSRAQTTRWEFRGGKYHNTNSHAPGNEQFKADNVVVLRVKVGDAGYLDPAGNPVPESIFKGSGQALVFHGGKLQRGTWSKKALDSALTLRSPQGEMIVPAGRTWIELVPKGADGGVDFSR